MSVRNLRGTAFTLSAPASGITVSVDLRGDGDRWIAVAIIDGRRELGIGGKPRAALEAALSALGDAARVALLADLALLGPSVELLRAADVAG